MEKISLRERIAKSFVENVDGDVVACDEKGVIHAGGTRMNFIPCSCGDEACDGWQVRYDFSNLK